MLRTTSLWPKDNLSGNKRSVLSKVTFLRSKDQTPFIARSDRLTVRETRVGNCGRQLVRLICIIRSSKHTPAARVQNKAGEEDAIVFGRRVYSARL